MMKSRWKHKNSDERRDVEAANMELRQLEYFVEVCRLKSFTHAARQLHVSQPSITNSLHKLECELGTKLLERSTKKVSLTRKGEQFFHQVSNILWSMNEAIREVQDQDVVQIGLPPIIGAQLFPDVFFHLHSQYPTIEFQVCEKGSVGIRNMLENGELDLGLIILPEKSETLHLIPLIDAQLLICLPKQHPLKVKRALKWKELENEQFIMLSEDYVHRQILRTECSKVGVTPTILFTSDKAETVKNMVAGGHGISMFMDLYMEDQKDTITVPLDPAIHIRIGLAWKKSKQISSSCTKTIQSISKYYIKKIKETCVK